MWTDAVVAISKYLPDRILEYKEQKLYPCENSDFHGGVMKTAVFWDTLPCNLV